MARFSWTAAGRLPLSFEGGLDDDSLQLQVFNLCGGPGKGSVRTDRAGRRDRFFDGLSKVPGEGFALGALERIGNAPHDVEFQRVENSSYGQILESAARRSARPGVVMTGSAMLSLNGFARDSSSTRARKSPTSDKENRRGGTEAQDTQQNGREHPLERHSQICGLPPWCKRGRKFFRRRLPTRANWFCFLWLGTPQLGLVGSKQRVGTVPARSG